MEKNLYQGIQLDDDTFFFCKENVQNIVSIKSILRGFELASRLKYTFIKVA